MNFKFMRRFSGQFAMGKNKLTLLNGLLSSYLTITDSTSYVHHNFPVSFLLYIATKKLNHIIIVNSSTNASITKNNSSLG